MKIETYITSDINLAHTVPCNLLFSQNQLTKIAIKSAFKNRRAFTLAETLITLTIIGVIAALTLPTLVSNYQKHIYVVGFKKAYSQIQNAVRMIPLNENCSAGDFECASTTLFQSYQYFEDDIKLFAKQFKTVKITNSDEDKNCANLRTTSATKMPCIYTEDGMIIGSSHGSGIAGLIVDTNGVKGPNKAGRDQFGFEVASKNLAGVQIGTVLPAGSKMHSKYKVLDWGQSGGNEDYYYWKNADGSSKCTATSYRSISIETCAGRIFDEGEMNY